MPEAIAPAAATSIPPPPDFRARYEWHAGAIPRSWSYSVVITADGQGEIEMTPAAEHERAWKERFTVHPFHLGWLYALTLEHEALSAPWPEPRDHSVGGSSETVTIRAGGEEVTIPPEVLEDRSRAARQLRQAVRSLVPAATWGRLSARG